MAEQLCNEIHRAFLEDQLDPFQQSVYSPSQNLKRRLEAFLENA